MLKIKYTLPESCSVGEVTLRETNGKDEAQANANVKRIGENSTSVIEELVKLSIVEVDGKAVVGGCLEYETWSTKTRGLVRAAWSKMNLVADDEGVDFLKQAQIVG